jgi:hypothetical protein
VAWSTLKRCIYVLPALLVEAIRNEPKLLFNIVFKSEVSLSLKVKLGLELSRTSAPAVTVPVTSMPVAVVVSLAANHCDKHKQNHLLHLQKSFLQ